MKQAKLSGIDSHDIAKTVNKMKLEGCQSNFRSQSRDDVQRVMMNKSIMSTPNPTYY